MSAFNPVARKQRRAKSLVARVKALKDAKEHALGDLVWLRKIAQRAKQAVVEAQLPATPK